MNGCGRGGSNLESKVILARSCASCPALQANQDTLEFVRNVKRFVASSVDIGNLKTELCDTFHRVPVEAFPTERYLDDFRNDRSTGTCGLAAMIMTRVLMDNGIDAYTYNFGFEGTRLTHVVTLVKLNNDLLIFDSYMNYELVDQNGKNLGIFRLMGGLRKGGISAFVHTDAVQGEFLLDRSLLTPEEQTMAQQEPYSSFLRFSEELNDRVIKVRYMKCFGCDTDPLGISFIDEMKSQLRSTSGEVDMVHLFTLKINKMYGASDHFEMNAKVDSALAELLLVPVPK